MEGIAGLGFWLFIGIVIAASSWEKVRKRQMKNDLVMRMIESGKDFDDKILENMISSKKKGPEERAEAQGVIGFVLILIGFGLAVGGFAIGLFDDKDAFYPFIGLGALIFLLGTFLWSKCGVFSNYRLSSDSNKDTHR